MKDPRFTKRLVFLNSIVPLSLLIWDWSQHHLGPNPVEFCLRTTGMLALIFLVLSLIVTPARKLTGQSWLFPLRKMLGLFAFFYACLHLLIYFIFDRSLSLAGTIADTLARPFIFLGMAALLLMVPLALTSTAASVKRLGAKRWKRLHQLIYISAIAAAVHYYLLVKADTSKPVAFASAVTVLLLFRLLAWMTTNKPAQRAIA